MVRKTKDEGGLTMKPLSPPVIPVDVHDFAPTLLKATIFNRDGVLPKTHRLNRRYVYDYELEFIIFSEGAMYLDGKEYPLQPGDVVFRRPGQITQGIMPYSCYLICFDLTGTSGKSIETYDFNRQTQFQPYYSCPFLDGIPTIFHPDATDHYQAVFDHIFTERINYHPFSPVILRSLILRLLHDIYQDITLHRKPVPNSPHYARLKRCIDHLHNNFTARICLEDIAKVTELSPTYFHRIFTETFGITPNAYLNHIRLNRAKELLVRTSEPISRIAQLCGFENPAYFSYVFKREQQCSPSEFRQRHSYL